MAAAPRIFFAGNESFQPSEVDGDNITFRCDIIFQNIPNKPQLIFDNIQIEITETITAGQIDATIRDAAKLSAQVQFGVSIPNSRVFINRNWRTG